MELIRGFCYLNPASVSASKHSHCFGRDWKLLIPAREQLSHRYHGALHARTSWAVSVKPSQFDPSSSVKAGQSHQRGTNMDIMIFNPTPHSLDQAFKWNCFLHTDNCLPTTTLSVKSVQNSSCQGISSWRLTLPEGATETDKSSLSPAPAIWLNVDSPWAHGSATPPNQSLPAQQRLGFRLIQVRGDSQPCLGELPTSSTQPSSLAHPWASV